MAIVTRATLKSYFETGDIPTQAQFIDLIDTLLSQMDYGAQTILQATADNTPVAITIAQQRILGRITGGNIAGLTAAQIRALLVLAESDSVKFLDVDATELSNKSGDLKLQPDVQGNVELFGDTNGNKLLKQHGLITAAAARKFISWLVDDTTDQFTLSREDATILGFKVNMALEVVGDIESSGSLKASGGSTTVSDAGFVSVNGAWEFKSVFGDLEINNKDNNDDRDVVFKVRNTQEVGRFRSLNKSFEITGAFLSNELSADPPDPSEGQNVTWQSDGTGSGDDGDIMMKITAGATTKTITLVDFSAF